ncbi:BsuPI-related putative proteinase inhibitor [Aquibacillus kalidii]|uniref:BsuPI-related putative proteinase inhibitor n=1 Tax=Aquibacillus kalidii TaxID=2762597 RepID=UPI00164524D8|nr:BsuPI-related putative proteinase inhibitor [Aquibacillus kalidii]
MKKLILLLMIAILFIVGCSSNEKVEQTNPQEASVSTNEQESAEATSEDTSKGAAEEDSKCTNNNSSPPTQVVEETNQPLNGVVEAGETNQADNETEVENTKDQTTTPPTGTKNSTPPRNNDGGNRGTNLTTNFEPCISFEQNGDIANFVFQVKNSSDFMFTFHFDSGKQFQYQIRDENGKVIRESDSTSSSKLPSEYPLKPGGAISHKISIKGLNPGSYTVTFVLNAKEIQPKAGLKFKVK